MWKEWLLKLLYPSCHLNPVWLLSLDLSHWLGISCPQKCCSLGGIFCLSVGVSVKVSGAHKVHPIPHYHVNMQCFCVCIFEQFDNGWFYFIYWHTFPHIFCSIGYILYVFDKYIFYPTIFVLTLCNINKPMRKQPICWLSSVGLNVCLCAYTRAVSQSTHHHSNGTLIGCVFIFHVLWAHFQQGSIKPLPHTRCQSQQS